MSSYLKRNGWNVLILNGLCCLLEFSAKTTISITVFSTKLPSFFSPQPNDDSFESINSCRVKVLWDSNLYVVLQLDIWRAIAGLEAKKKVLIIFNILVCHESILRTKRQRMSKCITKEVVFAKKKMLKKDRKKYLLRICGAVALNVILANNWRTGGVHIYPTEFCRIFVKLKLALKGLKTEKKSSSPQQ